MISKSEITNPGGAAGYYTDQQSAAEYYSGEQVPSAWHGKAAEQLGLTGPVDAAALTGILQGRVIESDPETGEARERQLGRTRIDPDTGERSTEHRAGWDFTISAPKSVSVQALVHGDDRALQAHRAATTAALDYLERHGAQTRISSGNFAKTDGLAVATFEHVSSRAGDPQLHTHALIANVTTRDGRACSLSNEKLFQHRAAADAVYHNTLSRELQRAGFAVQHDSKGHVEIASYSKDALRDFSTRSAEIEAALAERGQTRADSTALSRQAAALDTRHDKELPETRAAHADRWQAQAEALSVKPAERSTATAAAARMTRSDPEAAVDKAIAHLSEREAVFGKHDLHREAARFSAGSATIEQIEKEIDRRERSGDLVQQPGHKADLYTSRDALEAERDTAKRLDAGRGEHEQIMTPREFDTALRQFEKQKGFSLSDEQRAASRQILTGDDRFQGVQGLAGTGKTTMLQFVREAAEAKGWTVAGHSNGSEQAATMERESGIKSTTTASHLIDQQKTLRDAPDRPAAPARELRIMDEASMSGQRNFRDVIKTTEQSGARTVFLGDKLQHQSVEAGRAFERAQKHMPTATLGEASIRRQTTEHMKAAVSDVLARRHGDALRKIQTVEVRPERDKLAPGATREQHRDAARADNAHLVQRIAKDYTALPADQRAKTLVITATNADRKALNNAIRAELKASGALADGKTVNALRSADMTKVEAKRAENYAPGQVVQLQQDAKRAPYAKGAQLEVVATDSRTNTLTCRDVQGREVRLDPAREKLTAYTRETREFAQGDRIRFTENHKLPTRDGEGLAVRNGQSAIVEKTRGDQITLRIGEGKTAQRIEIDAKANLKAEHNYVTTSHSAQGLTYDKVFIHHNTEGGRHGDRETYVNITRAREEATLYTQDVGKAEKQAGAELQKTAALDLQPERSPAPDRQPEPERERTLEREL
uniref:Conjugative relaxase domain protein n=1 Tax=Thiomonas intermedia (strain K12) TaxID=75379 RepID=D5X4X6_THIK1